MSKLTTCKTCGGTIAKSARTCPHCGAKNKVEPSAWVIIVSLIFTAFIIFLIFTMFPDKASDSSRNPIELQSNSNSTDVNPPSASTDVSIDVEPGPGESAATVVSDEVGFDGSICGDCFEISIVGAKWTDALETSIGTITPENEGTKLLCLIFSAKNVTDKTQNVANAGFNAYVDGKKILPTVAAGSVDNAMVFVGAVSSGMEINGFSVWELPNDWKEFQTSYIDANTGVETNQCFVIHPEDIPN